MIRVDVNAGQSLAERISNQLSRLAWRTPLHSLRLRGRYPLKLLAVPRDPVAGDPRAGHRIREGYVGLGDEEIDLARLDFAGLAVGEALADHLHGFSWLRDLAAAADRQAGAPIAEFVVRRWLAVHGQQVTAAAWRPDLAGRRLLAWAAYAPYILSSSDLVYRSSVLNGLARTARHLDGSADKAPIGLARLSAWAGVIAAGLLIPGGEPRLVGGEAGLERALGLSVHGDGGIVSRSPPDQLDLVDLLARLTAAYDALNRDPPAFLAEAQQRAVAALLGVVLGDGALSSWQGGRPGDPARVEAVVAGSGVRTRPLRQPREWGFQRLAAQGTVVVVDAAPPPIARHASGGCASTLAFELSDGAERVIVNCGGGGDRALGADLALGLRSTAAHSTLVLADSNSTAIHADGSLGRGVGEIELDRLEQAGSSKLEASHDGYSRRFGFIHRRSLLLTADGRELHGDDLLLPVGRRRRSEAAALAVRFHLAPGTEATPTADGQAALLRMPRGGLWQFRCRGGTLEIEESLWIDGAGRPRPTRQLVVAATAPPGGAEIAWILKRAG
jgi:uncharacterized heparinase superfamily protein